MKELKSEPFSLVVNRPHSDSYSMYLYISDRNILEYLFQGSEHCTFTCHTLSYLVDWLEENMCYILDETDNCPYVCFDIPSNKPVMHQIIELSQSNTFSMWETMWTEIQPWYFRHSWLSARDGFYLADVCFRTVEAFVEISWYNYGRFENEGVSFVCPEGVAYINKEYFQKALQSFIACWEKRQEDGSFAWSFVSE